ARHRTHDPRGRAARERARPRQEARVGAALPRLRPAGGQGRAGHGRGQRHRSRRRRALRARRRGRRDPLPQRARRRGGHPALRGGRGAAGDFHRRRRGRPRLLRRRGAADGGGVRQDRRSGQQRRRAASGQGHRRHYGGAAAPHLSDQHLWLFPHGPGRPPAPKERGGDRELHQRDELSGFGRAARLFGDQGGDHRLHPIALAEPDRRRHPRERRRARADLDATQPDGRLHARENGDLRGKRANGPPRPAERGRARLSVPRLRGRELHERADPPPERRHARRGV
ncbi:MAG: 3-oxoacyl-[acyl-carrier protein] reductase, partial [uncultured Sphingomonadaceae bacterium]